MPLESKFTEQQLFDQLISSLVHTTWVSLGKIKNPMSDKIEKDMHAASVNIDMIDMLYKRMDGNLSEAEDKYMSQVLSELKMNYIHEKSQPIDSQNDDSSDSADNDSESDKKPQSKSKEEKKPKGKKKKK
ncbi:MAG: DUF1844 domain-containing protein [Candidatus Marinimicrobia bacterium]|jgi:hypothetical protein|nr:DUF1844 domain-containing protein [Candidatus Neomarinimicrobiota bacterium]|tara:strand:- start:966 stop:1355 length:390 start_codon:yes stop_codon:yes gene_type:complete